MPKKVRNYVCLVDNHRCPELRRNTAGRYRVGAKTEKEAEKILRQAVGFGKVTVYYEDTNPDACLMVKYGECFKEKRVGDKKCLVPIKHANQK